jgi:ABC-type multidrug transport system fused ATPase/permease subunit
VLSFDNLEQEKPLRTAYDAEIGLGEELEAAERGEDSHVVWPSSPVLEMRNVSGMYQPESRLTVEDISFKIGEQSKVAIVGRTGAGKSTIILALFRILEPE